MSKILNSIALKQKKIILKSKEWISIVPDFVKYHFTRSKVSNQEKIIFIGTIMHGRIARTAKWLKRQSDKELILVCSETGFSSMLSNDSFSSLLLYRNKWHLRSQLKLLDGPNVIFHLFGPPYFASFETLKFIKHGKTLFDYQDLMVSNFGLNPPFKYMKDELQKEKFVLNSVDGIISHSLELQTAKKYYGDILVKKLFFPNFTDNDEYQRKDNLQRQEIHLVYAGSIHSAYRNKDYFGGQQFHWLVEKLEGQNIHLHVYPTPTGLKEHLVDYIDYDNKLDYFHLHEPVSQENLSQELNKYDFGIIPFFHRTNKKLNDKRIYSTTLKMYNFFEAGIPIILGEDTIFQNFMGKRFGGTITAKWEDFDDLRKLIDKFEYDSLIQNIRKNREIYSLKNQIGKIEEFYSKL